MVGTSVMKDLMSDLIDAVSKIESCGNLYNTIKLRTQSKLYEQL